MTAIRSNPMMEALPAEPPGSGPPAPGRSEEQGWVERSRAGDAAAFRCLVERHQDRAYGLALRILRSPHEAEEVAQDAFVRAWLALPHFRGEARFSTWLYRIVARCAFDRAQALRRRRLREIALDAALSEPAGRAAPEAEDRARRMELLVAELPAGQRAAVTLYYYQGRSVAEAALALEMPEGTVKTHLSRARASLRRAWLRQERKGTT